jgi:pseudouridine-5'-phosphate glycosidase
VCRGEIDPESASHTRISSPGKNLPVSVRLDTPEEVVKFANTHWKLGMKSAVLVCQPVSANMAIAAQDIEPILNQVSNEVKQKQAEHSITGQQVTPYELMRVSELTGGKSLRTNLELLLNNARLAAQLARSMTNLEHQHNLL